MLARHDVPMSDDEQRDSFEETLRAMAQDLGDSLKRLVGEDFDLGLYRRAMGVNLDGVVFGAHACLGAMREKGGGAIVATASLAGLTPMPTDPIYSANKHGVVGLTRALGVALAGGNIRFNAVCPGFAESPLIAPVRSDLQAAGFEIIPAETVAETVVRLFAADVTGECWFVQPGRTSEPFRFRNVPGPRPTSRAGSESH